MRLMKNFIAILGSALTFVSFSGCYNRVVDNNDVERAKFSPPLPYKQLATDETHSIIDVFPGELSPEKMKAVVAFPGVRDCLIDSEKAATEPDLRLINWRVIKKHAVLDVCLMRIFQSLEDYMMIRDWADFHLLKGNYSGERPPLEDVTVSKLRDGTQAYKITFIWRRDLPFRGGNSVPKMLTDGYYIKVYFRKSDQKPILVSSKRSQSM